jgi:predicted DNA-binding protein (UPF0251 family)
MRKKKNTARKRRYHKKKYLFLIFIHSNLFLTKITALNMKANLQPKTRKQIAQELGISETTLWRKLKNAELIIPSGLVLYEHQKKIFQLFGGEDIKMKGNEKD